MSSPSESEAKSIWLNRHLRLQRETDVAIRKMLRDAMKDAEQSIRALEGRSGAGAAIRDAQLRTAVAAIRGRMGEMWAFLGGRIRASRERAAAEAIRAGLDWDKKLFRGTELSSEDRQRLVAMMEATAERNVQLAVNRVRQGAPRLSKQIYKSRDLALNRIDETVNSGLARGLSVRELAREVRRSVSPFAPGGASYAAMRLSRTEINAAYHNAAVQSSADKPWVQGMQWKLSATHSIIDVCNKYADQDAHNLGDGVFPKVGVPRKPHPNCLCYVVPALPSEEAFMTNFLRGEYDDYGTGTQGLTA